VPFLRSSIHVVATVGAEAGAVRNWAVAPVAPFAKDPAADRAVHDPGADGALAVRALGASPRLAHWCRWVVDWRGCRRSVLLRRRGAVRLRLLRRTVLLRGCSIGLLRRRSSEALRGSTVTWLGRSRRHLCSRRWGLALLVEVVREDRNHDNDDQHRHANVPELSEKDDTDDTEDEKATDYTDNISYHALRASVVTAGAVGPAPEGVVRRPAMEGRAGTDPNAGAATSSAETSSSKAAATDVPSSTNMAPSAAMSHSTDSSQVISLREYSQDEVLGPMLK
jgi:hypothetical protein